MSKNKVVAELGWFIATSGKKYKFVVVRKPDSIGMIRFSKLIDPLQWCAKK